MRCSTCPVTQGTCLGESVPRLCLLAKTRKDYRRELIQRCDPPIPSHPTRTMDIGEVLAAISSCPDRGNVLPPSQQPECGCSELSECRAGRGRTPGLVTLPDCVACVISRLSQTDDQNPKPGS